MPNHIFFNRSPCPLRFCSNLAHGLTYARCYISVNFDFKVTGVIRYGHVILEVISNLSKNEKIIIYLYLQWPDRSWEKLIALEGV